MTLFKDLNTPIYSLNGLLMTLFKAFYGLLMTLFKNLNTPIYSLDELLMTLFKVFYGLLMTLFKTVEALVRSLDELAHLRDELVELFGQFDQFARQQPGTHGFGPLGIFVQELDQVFYSVNSVHFLPCQRDQLSLGTAIIRSSERRAPSITSSSSSIS